MKILLLNGPPGCGKDTIKDMIMRNGFVDNPREEKFANPIRKATMSFFGFETEEELEREKRTDPKVREFMIGWSEDLIKPLYGKDWFGIRAAKTIAKEPLYFRNCIISDAGFQCEVDAFTSHLGYSGLVKFAVEFELWQISRKGCNFKNDSREKVSLWPAEGAIVKIKNNGSIDQLNEAVNHLSVQFFGDC